MRAFEAFKEANDRRLAEIERRCRRTCVTDEKLERIDRALDEHKRVVDELALEGGAAAARRRRRRARRSTPQHKAAFEAYVRARRGGHGLRALEEQGAVGRLRSRRRLSRARRRPSARSTARLRDVSPIRAIAGVRQVSGDVYKKPFAITGAGTGWVGETAARPQTATPTLAELAFPTMELYAMPAATRRCSTTRRSTSTSGSPRRCETAFAEQEGTAFVTGNGTNKPKGFLDYTKVADGSLELGQHRLRRDRRRRRLRRRPTRPTS